MPCAVQVICSRSFVQPVKKSPGSPHPAPPTLYFPPASLCASFRPPSLCLLTARADGRVALPSQDRFWSLFKMPRLDQLQLALAKETAESRLFGPLPLQPSVKRNGDIGTLAWLRFPRLAEHNFLYSCSFMQLLIERCAGLSCPGFSPPPPLRARARLCGNIAGEDLHTIP